MRELVNDKAALQNRADAEEVDPSLGGAKLAAKIRVFLIDILCVHMVASNEILITYLKCNVSLI